MNYGIGIDIGGTKTAIGLFDGGMMPCQTKVFPTQTEKGAADLVRRIAEQTQQWRQDYPVAFAGVACPGPLDLKEGRIIYVTTMGFRDVPIRAMLEQALGLPVHLENDATCAAIAEYEAGVAKGSDPLVYVTMSTGIGCGIVIGGQVLSGAFSSAGEIGHLTVERDGRACLCGKKGCLELYCSGTALAEQAGREAKAVFDAAREGDSEMRRLVDEAADYLGLGLSHVYDLLDPQAVVLGGSVTKSYDVFADALAAAIQRYTQPVDGRQPQVILSSFDGEQGMIGAYLYGKRKEK